MKVRDVIKMLEEDGWYLDRIRGSHRQFKHLVKKGTVTVVGKESIDVELVYYITFLNKPKSIGETGNEIRYHY